MKKAFKTAEKVIKAMERSKKTKIVFLEQTGTQIFGNMYEAYRIFAPFDFPECEPHNRAPFGRIINEAKTNNSVVLPFLPSLAELTAFIKTEKALHKGERGFRPLYDFGEQLPQIDAEYLKNALILCGDNVNAAARNQNPMLSAIYFHGDKGEGVVMPVRKKAVA